MEGAVWMTRRIVVYTDPVTLMTYRTPEFNGDKEEFLRYSKRLDICDENWDVIFKEFENLSGLEDFKKANERAQGHYHSFLGDVTLPVEEYLGVGSDVVDESMGKAVELHV